MHFKLRAVAAGAAAVLAMAASGASAKVMVLTFEGTGSDNPNFQRPADPRGRFGPLGASLVGAEYELTYVFDSEVSVFRREPGVRHLLSPKATGGADPVLSATLKVGRVAVDLPHNLSSGLSYFNTDGLVVTTYGQVPGFQPTDTVLALIIGPIAGDWETPFSWSGFCDSCLLTRVGAEGFFPPSGGHFHVTRATLAEAPPVPEPGTWALMIAGFGMAGMALRRRRPALSAG